MMISKLPNILSGQIFKRYQSKWFFIEESKYIQNNPLIKSNFLNDFAYVPNFITSDEESSLVSELQTYLDRRKYEFNHWDDAIHGFRETEKSNWTSENEQIIQRIRNYSFVFTDKILNHVHVLDLDKNGYIKPHIDSVKFCGNKIVGLSLLSDSVMRLIHEEDEKVQFTALIKRRSLYIMKDVIRFKFKHEILKNEESFFNNNRVDRSRRISLILRNEP